jgi:MoaA/NifB/PqqE/SkfB family radical SAM enzyme
MPKGINIELTSSQYEMLYDVIMMAYELEVPEQKGWDMQTYDNMVDNVCNGKSTILSNDVKGIMPVK